MAWDENAQRIAVNVIAHVEGSGAWDAINYRDPITVGLMQWYGTRAASILKDMKDNGTWSTSSDLAALSNNLETQSVSSRWWTTRYLSGSEGKALKPVLRANKPIQSATVSSDIDDYKKAAERIGMSPDSNTKAVQFFCCMYHQTPARAIRIVNAAGPNSSLERIYSFCMSDPVFKQYKTRYTTARNMIRDGNPPDIIELNDDDAPITDGDGDDEAPAGNNGERVLGDIRHIVVVGDTLQLKLKDGKTLTAISAVGNRYVIPRSTLESGATPPIPDDEENTGEPDPPPFEGDLDQARQTLITYADSVLGRWIYTNGFMRLQADKNKAGDCSAFVRECYKRVGVNLGLLTSHQYVQGTRIYSGAPSGLDMSKLKVGDLVYMKWRNAAWSSGKVTDHVEMMYSVAGDGLCVGHPGPGMGPRVWRSTSAKTYFMGASKIWVQRHLN